MRRSVTEQDEVAPLARQVPRGPSLQAFLGTVKGQVDLLQRAVETLPRVDANGESDCPYAEDLYARKDELAGQVGAAVVLLQEYLAGMKQEVERCGKNLARIQGDAGTLGTEGARRAYDHAGQVQRDAYERAVFDQNAIGMALPRAVAVLEVARSKKYPGKIPERRSSAGALPDIAAIGDLPSMPPKPLSREVRGLLASGALRSR